MKLSGHIILSIPLKTWKVHFVVMTPTIHCMQLYAITIQLYAITDTRLEAEDRRRKLKKKLHWNPLHLRYMNC